MTRLDLYVVSQGASGRVSPQVNVPNQESTSLLFPACYRPMPSGTNLNSKPVFPQCRQLLCTFLIDSQHKYFPTSICLLSPRLNYKFNQTLETHHLDFTEQFYAPYNVGGLNSACCQNLRMIFIQKIPRHISSWKLPNYLALNLIMIRFKPMVFWESSAISLIAPPSNKTTTEQFRQVRFCEKFLFTWVFPYGEKLRI